MRTGKFVGSVVGLDQHLAARPCWPSRGSGGEGGRPPWEEPDRHIAVDLVGADLEETMDLVLPGGLQQHVGAVHVGLDEATRVQDGPVHVGLGGEVDDGVHLGHQARPPAAGRRYRP